MRVDLETNTLTVPDPDAVDETAKSWAIHSDEMEKPTYLPFSTCDRIDDYTFQVPHWLLKKIAEAL